jgi:hypothetical protein
MDNTLTLTIPQFLGFYELDPDGTVLYSRIKRDDQFEKATSLQVGRNFFEDVLGYQNSEAFRRRFRRFVSDGTTHENFIFDYVISESTFPLKVRLMRISEHNGSESQSLIIVDIRQN